MRFREGLELWALSLGTVPAVPLRGKGLGLIGVACETGMLLSPKYPKP